MLNSRHHKSNSSATSICSSKEEQKAVATVVATTGTKVKQHDMSQRASACMPTHARTQLHKDVAATSQAVNTSLPVVQMMFSRFRLPFPAAVNH